MAAILAGLQCVLEADLYQANSFLIHGMFSFKSKGYQPVKQQEPPNGVIGNLHFN